MKLKNLLLGLDPSGDYLYEADGVVVHCPAHGDSQQSLKVTITDEAKALLACRAGCTFDAIVDASAIERPDLFNVEDADTVVPAGRAPTITPAAAPVAQLTSYCFAAADRLADETAAFTVEARTYLADRFGLTPELAAELDIGVDPGGSTFDFEMRGKGWIDVPRVVIPFRSLDGYIWGAQARAIVPHRMRWAGLRSPDGFAWGRLAVFDTGSGLEKFVITEGPGDAVTAYAAGYNAIALPGAAVAKSPEVQDALARHLTGKQVFIAGDADRAGTEFTDTLVSALDARGVPTYRLGMPDGIGDLADWFAADPDAFSAQLDDAIASAPPAAPTAPAAGPQQQAGPTYPQNDIGNALRLLDELGGNALHSPETGWLLWTGTHWQHDRLSRVRRQAQDMLLRLLAAAEASGNNQAEAFFRNAGTRNRIDALLVEAAARCSVDITEFDTDHDLLAVRNGVLDLRSGTLLPHDRSRLLTRCIDLDYDPDATCPRWERFLAEVFPHDPDLPTFIQRLVGYGITGFTTEQAFVVLHGTGANGKSVFIDVLDRVFGPITQTTPFSTFEAKPTGGSIPNDIAALKGARLVFASEGERGVKMAEAVLKRVTGQDTITARFMRREFFTFRPTFLILMATNHKPGFTGQDEGLWRRVKLVPFTRYFAPDERDHYLVDRLGDEAQGILTWAVDGARAWSAAGLGDPPSVVDATSNYRSTSDALDGLFPDWLVPERNARLDAPTAYSKYLEWAEHEQLPPKETWGRRAFYGAMEERGFGRLKSHGKTYIVGMRLPEPEPVVNVTPPSTGDRESIFGEPA